MLKQKWIYVFLTGLIFVAQGCFSAEPTGSGTENPSPNPILLPIKPEGEKTLPTATQEVTAPISTDASSGDFAIQIMETIEQADKLSFSYAISNDDNNLVNEGNEVIVYGRESSVSKSCPVVQYRVAGETSAISNLDGNIDLWPGAILRGSSVQNSTFEEILTPRMPGSLTLTGLPIAKHGASVPAPAQDTIEDTIHSLLPAIDTVPQGISILQRKEVYSLDEASYWIGATARIPYGIGSHIGNGSIKFDASETKTMVAFVYYREYYTIDFRPEDGGRFFNISDNEQLQRITKQVADNPPVYIKSVTYGRILGGIATVDKRTTDLEAALGYQFDLAGTTIEAKGGVGSNYENILEETTIYLFGSGGSSIPPATIRGNELLSYVRFDDKVSKLKPGAPLLYELRYISDNSVLKIPNEIVYEKLDEDNCIEHPLPPSEVTVTINDVCLLVSPRMLDYYYFNFGINIPSADFSSFITEREKLREAKDDPQCEHIIEYQKLKKTFQLPTQNGSCFEVYGEFWDNNIGWDAEIGKFSDQYCFYNGVLLLNGESIPNNFRYEKNIENLIKLRYTIN